MRRCAKTILSCRNSGLALAAFAVAVLLAPCLAAAHEIRPAYLHLLEKRAQADAPAVETDAWFYDVLWRRPVREGQSLMALLPLRLVFPDSCTEASPRRRWHRPGMMGEEFCLQCAHTLRGQMIGVEGLAQGITDALVDFERSDGERVRMRLTADRPVQLLGPQLVPFASYFGLGFQHLWLGWDHIAFVLGLLLLVVGWRRLVGVVTAFTIAHSLTLFIFVRGTLTLPIGAVEAGIALSVLYVAWEASLPVEKRDRFAHAHPYSLAFLFGLLHGGGFASVLAALGLPEDAQLGALLLFNLGLEAGQLSLIALYLGLGFVGRAILRQSVWQARAARFVPHLLLYPMGAAAVFWVLERSASILRLL